MHTYIYAYTYTCINVCVYVCVYMVLYIYICIYICGNVYVYIFLAFTVAQRPQTAKGDVRMLTFKFEFFILECDLEFVYKYINVDNLGYVLLVFDMFQAFNNYLCFFLYV